MMEKYNHIEFKRENVVKKYRFRPFVGAPRPPYRERKEHGKKLSDGLNESLNGITEVRVDNGIDSKNLIVLELEGDCISPDILDRLIRSFNMCLVEENTNLDDENKSRIIVQFDSENDIVLFNEERQLFEDDEKEAKILSYAQRRDIFNSINNIRSMSREDRMGSRLTDAVNSDEHNFSEWFFVDVDIWFNGKVDFAYDLENQIRTAIGTKGSELVGDLFELPSLLLGRVKVNEFSLNSLLELDIVAQVELPIEKICTEPYEIYDMDFVPNIINELDENAPVAAIIDSGIYTANPLFNNIVLAEEEFNRTENTTNDMNGHGTGVAGIVAYGDFSKCIEEGVFKSQVRLCNAKVLHDVNGGATFPDDKRPEVIVKEAIEFFYQNYNCRIFNVSLGDSDHVYQGGRQFAWAEVLDQLIKELDIVIIISAGNVIDPELDTFNNREELLRNTQNRLFYPEHRVIDPATSAMGVTVGSITRFETPQVLQRRGTRLSVGRKDQLSAFTRIGRGVNKAIKPELVDYGGNFAVDQMTRGRSRWLKNDNRLLEPTLNNTSDKNFRGYCGTSFSAPHVTNYAARIERALENQLNELPSANLIRAMLVNTAQYNNSKEWFEDSTDAFHKGSSNPKQARRLRLTGYGKSTDDILFSNNNHVTVFAEDSLELRSFHLYKIPVPRDFLTIKAKKRISISLAYNPSTRVSRKEYLTNNLWFEVFRKIDEETLLKYKEKKESGEDAEGYLDSLPDVNKAKFSPGSTEILKGTLQQRTWEKGERGGTDLLWDIDNPYIYILVTGKERFKYAEQDVPQDYAMVVTFSFDAEEDINLYNTIQSQINVRERQQERERVQAQYR